jgi:hypothetical protein
MNRAIYGTLFWISAPDKLATLHKFIRVEGINQLVRKTYIGFVYLCLQIVRIIIQGRTDTFVNKYSMLTLSNLVYSCMGNA